MGLLYVNRREGGRVIIFNLYKYVTTHINKFKTRFVKHWSNDYPKINRATKANPFTLN